jgi:hypothetical protein
MLNAATVNDAPFAHVFHITAVLARHTVTLTGGPLSLVSDEVLPRHSCGALSFVFGPGDAFLFFFFFGFPPDAPLSRRTSPAQSSSSGIPDHDHTHGEDRSRCGRPALRLEPEEKG